MQTMITLVLPRLSFQVTGCCFVVHNKIGRFSSEQQYSDALAVELGMIGLTYEQEKVLPTTFAGERPGRSRLDFLVEGRLVIELKAKPFVTRTDYDQMQRYLHTLNLPLGLIVNFHQRILRPKRILNAAAPPVKDIA